MRARGDGKSSSVENLGGPHNNERVAKKLVIHISYCNVMQSRLLDNIQFSLMFGTTRLDEFAQINPRASCVIRVCSLVIARLSSRLIYFESERITSLRFHFKSTDQKFIFESMWKVMVPLISTIMKTINIC